MSFQPPPQRTDIGSRSSASPADTSTEPNTGGWKAKMKARGAVWGKKAIDKGIVISDNIGGKVNTIAEKKFGTEHFWPVTGDFGREMDKCARILRAFTVDGVVTEEPVSTPETPSLTPSASGTDLSSTTTSTSSEKAKSKEKKKNSKKVLRKIPPKAIANAKGLVIFTAMRTGFAPFGGAGGAGVVVAKLPDGTWSAPSSISPNNLSAGFLIGVDVYDAVLIVNSQKALDSFKTHKATLGAELGVAAGPYGAGTSVEAGMEKAPIWSYVRSRGMYAGVEVVGQVFVERFDENAAMYHWPGVKAGDILAGKVKVPREAAALHQALQDAETGRAQAANPQHPDGAEVVQNNEGEMIIPDAGGIKLNDGEVMSLPPTPSMMDGEETGQQQHQAGQTINHHPVNATHDSALLTPTPTPPRLPARPSITQQHSSNSHYAPTPEPISTPSEVYTGTPQPSGTTPIDPFSSAAIPSGKAPETIFAAPPAAHLPPTDQAAPDGGLPPAYDDTPDYAAPYTAAVATGSGYPDEKAELRRRDEAEAAAIAAQGASGSTGHAGFGSGPETVRQEAMSESERREWAEAAEMERLERENGQQEMSDGMRGMHLHDARKNEEDESLR